MRRAVEGVLRVLRRHAGVGQAPLAFESQFGAQIRRIALRRVPVHCLVDRRGILCAPLHECAGIRAGLTAVFERGEARIGRAIGEAFLEARDRVADASAAIDRVDKRLRIDRLTFDLRQRLGVFGEAIDDVFLTTSLLNLSGEKIACRISFSGRATARAKPSERAPVSAPRISSVL